MMIEIAFLKDEIKICDLHVDRIKLALKNIKHPITVDMLEKLSDEDIAYHDLLIYRFSRLQNRIGRKVFPLILQSIQEYVENGTFIDQLNKLEKLGIIQSVDYWDEMRDMRNFFTHDYPDDVKLMASRMNRCIEKSEELIEFWISLKKYIHEKVSKGVCQIDDLSTEMSSMV